MSMDKKQNSPGDSSGSNSSLPLFSPSVDKDPHHSLDFSAEAIGFQSCHSLDNQPAEHSYPSLHLITNKSITVRDCHEEELHLIHQKEDRICPLSVSQEREPTLQKEKISLGEDIFQVPELTAESLLSSEDIDFDSQCYPNDLPLCSTRRHKIGRVFQEPSQGSDQYEDRCKVYLAKQNYAESKGSDRSESDDFPSICKLCYALAEKSKTLESENAQLMKETQTAKDELAKAQEKHKRLLEREQQMHMQNMAPLLLKEHFLTQIQEMTKILHKVNEFLSLYAFDFRGKDCQSLQRFSLQFKKLEKEVLGKVEKQMKRRDLQQVHNGYKKVISKLMKDFEEREAKKDLDFKKIITTIARRPPAQQHRSFQGKSERSRRKSKTYAQREDNTEVQLIENNRQWQQSRQRQEWLEMGLARERDNWHQQQRSYIQKNQRSLSQISDLTHQRNTYRSLAGKYSQEFADFMLKLTKQQRSSLTQSQFFRSLSQRVFEISNCIPFEENDEQNLFAPQSQQQLFEMLDRVRRFYRRIQEYNLQRDSQFDAEKSTFMRFLKELVEQNKVSPKLLLETLEGNSYSALGYLKELIRSSRIPEYQHFPQRESIQNRVLKIDRTKSFTITSNSILYHKQ